ncbi:MAG TPA: cyclic nucleotide-binding domain-containing protein [Gaiellaceae bacterium]|nr:cyclic nucleotide-binding domain-containing protein [Gaiellaceae bacterium]
MALDAATLKRVTLFAGLDDKEAKKVASLFKERDFTAGEAMAEEGKHGIGFFVIESGEAKVTVHGEERTTLGPGSYFGEIALIDDGPRTATVTATSDVTAHVLIAWDFRPLVKEEPKLAWGLLEGMAQMLRAREAH